MSINLFHGETNDVAITAKASPSMEIAPGLHSYQATASTTDAGSAVIDIQGSNELTPTNWVTLGTISLSPNNSTVTDGFTTFAAWKYTRANITTLTGTSPQVKVWVN